MKNRNNILKWLIIASLPLLLVACDPAQTLLIRNETSADVELTIVFEKGNSYQERFMEAMENTLLSDTLRINLDTTAQNSAKEFYFGMGHWKVQHELDSLAASVEFIAIKTAKSTATFSTEAEIKTFFEERLVGRMNERIEIIISDDK